MTNIKRYSLSVLITAALLAYVCYIGSAQEPVTRANEAPAYHSAPGPAAGVDLMQNGGGTKGGNIIMAGTVNCNRSKALKSGKFGIQVEPAISITVSEDVDLGEICPGCEREWENGDKCLEWSVTGGQSCFFHAAYGRPAIPSMLTLDWIWMYRLNTGNWRSFRDDEDPGQGSDDYPNNDYRISDRVNFRVCATRVTAAEDAQPSSIGMYTFSFSVTVNYVSSI